MAHDKGRKGEKTTVIIIIILYINQTQIWREEKFEQNSLNNNKKSFKII